MRIDCYYNNTFRSPHWVWQLFKLLSREPLLSHTLRASRLIPFVTDNTKALDSPFPRRLCPFSSVLLSAHYSAAAQKTMGKSSHHGDGGSRKRTKTKFNIFPGGDRVFIVGTGNNMIKVRVSSAVVSAASEAFAAMLSSGFKESEQKEITLSEEDPDTMLIFFNVIHGQPQDIEQRDAQQLINLAVMADMWMCAGALKDWVKEQLQPVTQNISRDMNFGILLPSPGKSNVKKEWKMWEADKHLNDTYICTVRNRRVEMSFDIKDLIDIAIVFELDDLLWHASRISLAYSPYTATQDIPRRIAFPPKGAGEGDSSIHSMFPPANT